MVQPQSLTTLSHVQVGAHNIDSLNDFPTMSVFLELVEPAQVRTKRNMVDRSATVRGDGRALAPLNGKQEATIAVSLRVAGLSRASDTAASSPSTTQTELTPILNALMGSDGVSQTGSTVTASADDTVTVASASGFSVGGGVMLTTSGGGVEVYEVRSISGNVLTLDRDVNGSATGSAIASAAWHPNYSNSRHKHLAVDAEGETSRVRLFGCLGNMTLNAGQDGGPSILNGTWTATSWDFQPKDDPVFTAPVKGDDVQALDAALWIDGVSYDATSASLDFGVNPTPQNAITAPNGFNGHRVLSKAASLSLSLYYDDALFQALADDVETTHAILLQVGRVRGRCWAVYIPKASVMVERGEDNGQDTLTITAKPTRDVGNFDLSFHLF